MSTHQTAALDSPATSPSYFENLPGLKPMMTENELAKLVGGTRNTTAGWRKRGEGPDYIRLPSGEYRYFNVGKWLASKANPGNDSITA